MTTYPWFGTQRSRWPTVPIRKVCRLGTGHTPNRLEPEFWRKNDCVIPWVTVADIHRLSGLGLFPLEDTEQHISDVGLANSAAVLHPPGTVMVSRTASIGFACRIGRPMATTQAFATWTPGPRVESRYLLLVTKALAPEFERLAYGSTHLTIYMPDIESVSMPLPPLPTQRRIADDVERATRRIDELIDAKRHMVELMDERDSLVFDRAIRARGFELPPEIAPEWKRRNVPRDWAVMNLSQVLVQLTNGFVGPTRDILVEEGVPYVQSLHIKNGAINFGRRPFFVTKSWHDKRPRVHLREGDVLIVQTGDIGQVAVVPPGFGEASCHALQIARVKRDLITGRYLGAYLRSSFGYHSLLSRATGALHPHLEGGIKNIPVVVPPIPVQNAIVEDIEQAIYKSRLMRSTLSRQIDLLRERRFALVTAAVTGLSTTARESCTR